METGSRPTRQVNVLRNNLQDISTVIYWLTRLFCCSRPWSLTFWFCTWFFDRGEPFRSFSIQSPVGDHPKYATGQSAGDSWKSSKYILSLKNYVRKYSLGSIFSLIESGRKSLLFLCQRLLFNQSILGGWVFCSAKVKNLLTRQSARESTEGSHQPVVLRLAPEGQSIFTLISKSDEKQIGLKLFFSYFHK